MVKVRLDDESQEKIAEYEKKELISKDIYEDLWRATAKTTIVSILRQQLSVNEITYPRIWSFIIDSVWTDLDNIFSRTEIMFFKILLANDGVLIRANIKVGDEFTKYMINRSIRDLSERGIVDVLSLTTLERLVILSPSFRADIFRNKSELKNGKDKPVLKRRKSKK